MASRRRFLVVLGASSAAVACGSSDGSPFTSNNDPDLDAGTSATGDAGSGSDGTTPPPDTSSACTPAPRDVGALTSFPANSWNIVGSGRTSLIIGHDSGGVYAFSAICPHAGCVVDPPDTSGNTFCSCHGAAFDANGNVTSPPARTALRNYAVTLCGGRVQVDTSKVVAIGTRAKA